MKSKIYYADTREDTKNCLYPHAAGLLCAEQLSSALQHDHVLAKFKGSYRSREHFISSTAVGLDIDNDHSEAEEDWIDPEDIQAMVPDVAYVLVFSRHHNREKGQGPNGKSARPRFHILFPIKEVRDADAYEHLKRRIMELFPFADRNASDAAKMFFGTEKPDFVIHDGTRLITNYLPADEAEETEVISAMPGLHSDGLPLLSRRQIPLGSRNKTMHSYALSVLKRFGDTEDAYDLYLRKADTCEIPLPDEELKAIWKSARKYYGSTISADPGYLPPALYDRMTEPAAEPEWEEPVPPDFFEYPEFPLHALPETVRNYVKALSASVGAPVEMAACYALAIIALCNQKKYVIEAKPGWQEPLNLYILIIAEKSERKSQIINAMTNIVLDYQNQYNRLHRIEMEVSKDDIEFMENQLKKVKKQRSSGKATRQDVTEAEEALLNCKILTPLELFVDDTTSEALCREMAANNEKMAVFSSEGDVFGNICDRYSADPNISIWLKAYSGDYYKSDRVVRGGEELQKPALTIGIASQPTTLKRIMGSKELHDRGLTARFLISIPKSLVGTRTFDTPLIPEDVEKQFRALVFNMLEAEPSVQPAVITLSPEAGELLHRFYDEVEAKLPAEYASFSGWAGKLVGNVARIAGNLCRASILLSFEVFDDYTCDTPLVVNAEMMQNAIDLGRYFTAVAKFVFSSCCDMELLTLAKRILDLLRNHGMTEFSMRDLTRHLSTGSQQKEVLEPVLALLTERGYIAPNQNHA